MLEANNPYSKDVLPDQAAYGKAFCDARGIDIGPKAYRKHGNFFDLEMIGKQPPYHCDPGHPDPLHSQSLLPQLTNVYIEPREGYRLDRYTKPIRRFGTRSAEWNPFNLEPISGKKKGKARAPRDADVDDEATEATSTPKTGNDSSMSEEEDAAAVLEDDDDVVYRASTSTQASKRKRDDGNPGPSKRVKPTKQRRKTRTLSKAITSDVSDVDSELDADLEAVRLRQAKLDPMKKRMEAVTSAKPTEETIAASTSAKSAAQPDAHERATARQAAEKEATPETAPIPRPDPDTGKARTPEPAESEYPAVQDVATPVWPGSPRLTNDKSHQEPAREEAVKAGSEEPARAGSERRTPRRDSPPNVKVDKAKGKEGESSKKMP
jgi:hypothetical protein